MSETGDVEPVGLGFVATYRTQTYPAAIGPGGDDVVLFSETPAEGFERGRGYWRLAVNIKDLEQLTLLRTVGAFGGEPCLILDEDENGESGGLHIAYTGHNGMKAEALGYWLVDHGAYEVVVPREEVQAIRVERITIPCQPG
ncbi:hypothetical protein Aph01nite_56630 [Acrocarpospora phusangensis]|uniref:Uncharacterized protein n=1 Tax=Acrocarpospora phusangensis TaxID=1070424 RepID=A0A919QEP8_9ACTN|nr:hypothetical protein [Acrocarpospora phusangensis]GIH27353.1 hypothetical protein Aph01nite_56630 [Acrocarpospora phusangensis]